MEKVELQQTPKAGVAGKFIGMLAGAVAILAVAFIIFIASFTWLLQQQQECDTATAPAPVTEEHPMTRNIDVSHNTTAASHERITVYPESRIEYVVNRNAKTGHVETVVTVDYGKKTTTLYSAADNTCYMAKEHVQDYDTAMDALQEASNENKAEKKVGMHFIVGEKVKNASEIPVQMAAFCTTQNTHLLEEYTEEQGGRHKRQDVYACIYTCYFLYYPWVTAQGNVAGLYYCLFYLDLSQDCNSPDTDVNYDGYAYIYFDNNGNPIDWALAGK